MPKAIEAHSTPTRSINRRGMLATSAAAIAGEVAAPTFAISRSANWMGSGSAQNFRSTTATLLHSSSGRKPASTLFSRDRRRALLNTRSAPRTYARQTPLRAEQRGPSAVGYSSKRGCD